MVSKRYQSGLWRFLDGNSSGLKRLFRGRFSRNLNVGRIGKEKRGREAGRQGTSFVPSARAIFSKTMDTKGAAVFRIRVLHSRVAARVFDSEGKWWNSVVLVKSKCTRFAWKPGRRQAPASRWCRFSGTRRTTILYVPEHWSSSWPRLGSRYTRVSSNDFALTREPRSFPLLTEPPSLFLRFLLLIRINENAYSQFLRYLPVTIDFYTKGPPPNVSRIGAPYERRALHGKGYPISR